MKTQLISSLEKIFWDEAPQAASHVAGSALRGERYAFQLLCREDSDPLPCKAARRVTVESPFPAELFAVESVPVTLPAFPFVKDDNYLRRTPGLYPDPLRPMPDGIFHTVCDQPRCVWISVTVPADAPAGKHPIRVEVQAEDGTPVATEVFTLTVIPAVLPPQTLVCTHWFHCDCLAVYYGVPVFSEAHWALLKNYIRQAAENGINLLLTPLFTPPLDTAIGAERPTVQLVDVTVTETGYRFGFDRLERYMTLAQECGIRYFEMSHLFTQWGAAHAPKIVADVNGTEQRIFGWETDSHGEEYVSFLRTFLQTLLPWLKGKGWLDRCYFHISDEPNETNADSYQAAAESVMDLLEGLPVIDALSHFEFYEKGIVRRPIPATNAIEPFLEANVPQLWTYYCCGQGEKVSNRFMAMPSARTRILGWQLFKHHIEGFLQWGYNFWFARLSTQPIDPYKETGAMDYFPAGDAFEVYPGEGGQPFSSLRQQTFVESLQDMRALQLLARYLPEEEILSRLGLSEMTFAEYPRKAEEMLALREQVNELIAAYATE